MSLNEIVEAKDYIKSIGVTDPEIGIVLGTGLSHFLNEIEIINTIPYTQIPGFPIATVEFHKGNLIYGNLGSKKVLVMQGRFHAYEGYSMNQIVFPIRAMKLLGIKNLFLSNAAGGINLDFKKGELVLIDDHINLQNFNPLIGKNIDDLGPRFPDMSQPYSEVLNDKIKKTADKLKIKLKQGVYASVQGPLLETRAEYRYLKIIGADLVGMSTVPEVIAANHMQLPCAAISVVTDECDPDHLQPVNIQEIIAIAGHADKKLSAILVETINSL